MNYLFVGIGGIFGALARCYLSTSIHESTLSSFPFGTLCVNLIGSFLLSFIAYASLLSWNLPRKYILAVNTGFIGSFTTFSAFSLELVNLIINNNFDLAIIYVSVSLIGGLGLSWLGIKTAYTFYQQEQKKGDQRQSLGEATQEN
ncbi:MAG: fluoride efflux transporter CrcB [Firmicutes bacterium]|nr:fluoride efflux transporter CrcB [Bacillota bacterium]